MGRWLALSLLLGSGCDRSEASSAPDPTEPWVLAPGLASATPVGSEAPIPTDATSVLVELAPIPGDAVVIVYDVIGPAGLSGSLEVLAARGGYRRDNWVLTLPLPEGPREIRGSAVQTPEFVWRAEGETAGTVEPGRMLAVAEAIAALDPVLRGAVIDQVRLWHGELAVARAQDPGEQETIAGVSCVRVRAGGGEVCTWEEAGLPLRYDGATFSIVAAHVEHSAQLGMHAFDIPSDAARTPLVAERHEVGPQLVAIAAGDRAALLRLLVLDSFPGLSLAADGAG